MDQSKSLLIESTLAGKALLPKIRLCRHEALYSVKIVYLFLATPQICRKRVEIRVRKGGHDVPYGDIQRRFGRSLDHFWHHYRHDCDQWQLIYNGEGVFQEVARQSGAKMYVFDEQLFVTFQEMVKHYGQKEQH